MSESAKPIWRLPIWRLSRLNGALQQFDSMNYNIYNRIVMTSVLYQLQIFSVGQIERFWIPLTWDLAEPCGAFGQQGGVGDIGDVCDVSFFSFSVADIRSAMSGSVTGCHVGRFEIIACRLHGKRKA
eukprot:s1421_g13.t1